MTLLGKLNSAMQDQQRSLLAQGSDAFNRDILASLTLMDLCLREHGSKCAPDTGSYPAYTVTGLSLVRRVLSKALNACSQSLSNKQMISLRSECQKRNKDNGQL